jgi:hypothetical protein
MLENDQGIGICPQTKKISSICTIKRSTNTNFHLLQAFVFRYY